jgi:hypothetical protein
VFIIQATHYSRLSQQGFELRLCSCQCHSQFVVICPERFLHPSASGEIDHASPTWRAFDASIVFNYDFYESCCWCVVEHQPRGPQVLPPQTPPRLLVTPALSIIMLMNSSTVKHSLGSLPFVQEFTDARKRQLMDSYGMTLSEMLADPELQQLLGSLDCGYCEHILGIISNVASYSEIRKGLVLFPLINNILAKILREGSSLAKRNAALAIKGMALDAGFRADALAYGMPKYLIAMLNSSDHQVAHLPLCEGFFIDICICNILRMRVRVHWCCVTAAPGAGQSVRRAGIACSGHELDLQQLRYGQSVHV